MNTRNPQIASQHLRRPALHWLCLVLALLALQGCAALAPPKPLADEAEVRATRGTPEVIWDNPDGTRSFQYPTQPNGTSTWTYVIDPAGKVVGQYDALAPNQRERVKPGMNQEDVRRLLGRERSIQRFSLSGEEVWDWNVPRDWPGVIATLFNVHFVDGKVVRTSLSHIHPDGDGDFRFGFGIGRGVGPHWGVGVGWGWPGPWGWPYGW